MPRSNHTRLVSLTSVLFSALLLVCLSSGCCVTPVCMTGGGACGSCGDGMITGECGSCSGGAQFPATCGTCTTGNCGGLSGLVAPLLSTRLACGSGCGGVYWNEWVSDPPVCCDPCDDCGCWVGPRCDTCAGSSCEAAIRRGPLGIVGAAWHGVTGAVGTVLHTGLYGYRTVGCGCAECSAECSGMSMGCDSCGSVGCDGSCNGACDGDCAQSQLAPAPMLAAQTESHSIRPVAAQGQVSQNTRPPHRVVTQRLRR